MRSSRTIILLLLFGITAAAVRAQMYKAAPLPVQRSTFVAQLKALRASNTRATPAELARAANEILDKNGINFAVSFDKPTCDRIKNVKAQQKDPSAPLTLGTTLKSVDAEGASLILPEPIFSAGDCGCFIELPLLQLTDRDFIAVVSGQNIKFHLPSNFFTEVAVLVDAKEPLTVKRRWRIPFRSSPIGVSHDENVLYLAFHEPELADLSLIVFGEGVFQIGTRSEAEEGGKGKSVEGSGAERLMRFDRWGKSYLVRYRDACR